MSLQDYLLNRYAPTTARAYLREIALYLCRYPAAHQASHQQIVTYLGALRPRYGKPATLNRILASLKAYYHFLSHTGQRSDNPAQSIHLRDQTSRDIQLQDLFTEPELAALLSRKERYNALEYRNQVVMSLLIYQALKPQEMAGLTTAHVNLTQASISIPATPTSNGRQLTLKANQILLFHHYQTDLRNQLLKGTSSQMFLIGHRARPLSGEDITKHVQRRYQGLYHPRKVNARTIRQSVITNLLKAGNDLRIVQVFAGHKYPSTTERYQQTNLEALKTAIGQYHPIQ